MKNRKDAFPNTAIALGSIPDSFSLQHELTVLQSDAESVPSITGIGDSGNVSAFISFFLLSCRHLFLQLW